MVESAEFLNVFAAKTRSNAALKVSVFMLHLRRVRPSLFASKKELSATIAV
jgi:hypothetical protein